MVNPGNRILLINEKEQAIHETAWMNLKGVMMSERRRSQKIMSYIILWMRHSKQSKAYGSRTD